MNISARSHKISIQALLSTIILLAILLPSSMIVSWLWYSAKETLLKDALERAELSNQVESALLESEVQRIISLLENKSDPIGFALGGRADKNLITDLLQSIFERETAFREIAVIDRQFEMVAYMGQSSTHAGGEEPYARDAFYDHYFPASSGLSIETLPVIAIPISGRIFIGASEIQDDAMSFSIAVPVGDRDMPSGILIGRLHIDKLWASVESTNLTEMHSQHYLVNQRGDLLASSVATNTAIGTLLTHMRIVRAALSDLIWDADETYDGLGGSLTYGNYAPVGLMNWTLISEIPIAYITDPIMSLLRNGTIFIALVTLCIIIIGFMVVARMMIPVRRITQASDLAAKGTVSQQLPSSAITEFDAMYRSFDAMTTARADMEEELRIALVDAEQANTAKSELVATMSHEFRTPLNAILGFSDMIRAEYFGPVGAENYKAYANDIHVSGQHMLNLVNDVLDIAAIEAGKRTLFKEAIDIESILTNCVRNLELLAKDGGIDLSLDVPDDLPSLHADLRSITQIVLNILSNAIKFTDPSGTVSVTVTTTDDAITIRVADTGIGIPADRLREVREPFSQAHADPHIAQQGTGLGLAIVCSLVEAHDGGFGIESDVGKGTTVTVSFPCQGAAFEI